MSVGEAAADLMCAQVLAPSNGSAVRIGMVGDSITAGVDASDASHAYPQQLQQLLDAAHGKGAFAVTNLGACGSTMRKGADSPFWQRPQFDALTKPDGGKGWDILTIMLGTNDAKDPGSKGPNNWPHDCGGVSATTVEGCSFATDYLAMISLTQTLGPAPGVPPKIFALIPPPLMRKTAIGANQTVINSVLPKLIPLIAAAAKGNVTGVVDVFSGMGGVPDWSSKFPESCPIDSTWPPCKWWCDKQACDDCHPNNDGYTHLAGVVQAGLGL